MGGSMWSLKEQEDLHFDDMQLLHCSFINGTWDDNLCDLQLLTRSKPILEHPIERVVGSVSNRATYLISA